jgi:separase
VVSSLLFLVPSLSVSDRGCSSGSLTRHGIHDPIGAPVTYLTNGAPWVIGNLWDVTDKDLDRLSITCMERLFDGNGGAGGDEDSSESPVSSSLSLSRDVCKLKSAVGSAPVLYGIPIGIEQK